MKKIIIILVSIISINSYAQILQESKIVDTFNTNTADVFSSIELRDNSIFICNSINPLNSYADSIKINIYKKNGSKTNTRNQLLYGSKGKIADVEQMKNGNIAIAVETKTNSSIIILDSIGNYKLHKTYARPDTNIHIVEIAIDNNNNILILSQKITNDQSFICGLTSAGYLISYITYLVKIDMSGNLIWNKIISTDNINYSQEVHYFNNISIDKSFNSDNSFNIIKLYGVNYDSLVRIKLDRYDNNGNLVWNKLITPDSIGVVYCYTHYLGFAIYSNYYTVFLKDKLLDFNKNGDYLGIHPYNNIDYENCAFNFSNKTNTSSIEFNRRNLNIGNVSYIGESEITIDFINSTFYSKQEISIKTNNWKILFNRNMPYESVIVGFYPYNDSTLLYINTRKTPIGNSYNQQFEPEGQLVFHTVSINDNQIEYSAYIDYNNNGVFDNTDTTFNNGFVQITTNNQTENNALDDSGHYTHFAKNGMLTSKLVNYNQAINYFTIHASHDTTIFNGSNKFDTIIFRLVPIPNIQDLEVYITPTSPARPGFAASYIVHAKNIGTKTIHNINVKFLKDIHQNIIDSALFTIVNDTVIWSIDSLAINQSINYSINCLNDTVLTTADTLHLFAAITPFENDAFVLDNTFILNQNVVNSFDPNDKLEAHGAGISPQQFSEGNYLYYTIRFQNTGNSYATKIKIVDTLSAHLDWSTLELLSSSHTFSFNVQNNNVITWSNDNLYLPDSTTDEAGSHGYVSFRIKPNADFSNNDVIQNRAHIYFDFNAPVITNTTSTVILQERITAIKQNIAQKIKLFPSPTNGNVQLQFDITDNKNISLNIIDINGKMLLQKNIQPTIGFNTIDIDLSDYANGIYFIQLVSNNEKLYYGKVMKQ